MVTTTEKVTKIMVNSRYWLENVKVIEKIVDGGVTIDQHFQKRVSEVGGVISARVMMAMMIIE